MKIIEIISEGKLRTSQEYASPGTSIFPQLDNNNHPYLAYRFGVALAPSPDNLENMDTKAAMGSNMTVITYTEEEAEIVKKAGDKVGAKQKVLATKGSQETKVINTTSPVAKPKRNKYGI